MSAAARRRPDWWPSATEVELLRAVFARDDAIAVSGWRALRASAAPDAPSGELGRLRPLLYERLCAAGVSGPELDPLRREYALARSVNARTRVQAREALERLASRDIVPVLLKGLALDALQDERSARRIGDLDLWIRASQLRGALAALGDGGFAAIDVTRPGALEAKHSTCLRRDLSAEIDLHWVLSGRLAVHRDPDVAMAPFWERTRTASYLGMPVLMLHPMDQVLHLIAHGALVESRAVARWLADVATVLGAAAPASEDWRVLIRTARAVRATRQTSEALRCLDHVWPGLVPEWVGKELAATAETLRERLLWTIDSRTVRAPLALDVLRTLRAHLANQRHRSLLGALLLYPLYLRANRYVVSPLQLARHAARRRREQRAKRRVAA